MSEEVPHQAKTETEAEEERLRERLKAKAQQNRRGSEAGSSSSHNNNNNRKRSVVNGTGNGEPGSGRRSPSPRSLHEREPGNRASMRERGGRHRRHHRRGQGGPAKNPEFYRPYDDRRGPARGQHPRDYHRYQDNNFRNGTHPAPPLPTDYNHMPPHGYRDQPPYPYEHPAYYGNEYGPPGGPPAASYYGGPGGAPRGPPPPRGRYHPEEDDFGRARRRRDGGGQRRHRSRSPAPAGGRGGTVIVDPVAETDRSRSRSRSYSSASSEYSRERSRSRSRDRRSARSPSVTSSSASSRSSSSRSPSPSSRSTSASRSVTSASSSSSSIASRGADSASSASHNSDDNASSSNNNKNNVYTKDQRTVFVNQLVMRTTERDIRKYFKSHDIPINEIILIRDKRTGRHKGCAYIELRRIEDVAKALALSGQAPDFQCFPVLIKASEAEKNYSGGTTQATVTAEQMGVAAVVKATPLRGPNGELVEAQKVYVGSLDPNVTQEHLFAVFSHFGPLEKVALQMDGTGRSKGFAFLSFVDPKDANLAIQTMANQIMAGRPIKTGWANHVSNTVTMVTSDEFPPDAGTRSHRALTALAQLTMGVMPLAANVLTTASMGAAVLAAAGPPGSALAAATVAGTALFGGSGVSSSIGPPRLGTVAEARASLAAQVNNRGVPMMNAVVPTTTTTAQGAGSITTAANNTTLTMDPMQIGNAERPTRTILVYNMFDKDQETEEGWPEEIRAEFVDECAKFGTITQVTVMYQDPGGKIYAAFDTVLAAQRCASSLAGRWFDQRQLRVEFVPDDVMIPQAK